MLNSCMSEQANSAVGAFFMYLMRVSQVFIARIIGQMDFNEMNLF